MKQQSAEANAAADAAAVEATPQAASEAAPEGAAEAAEGSEEEAKPAEAAAPAAKPARPVVAVRGDDRPGANKAATSAAPGGRPGRPGDRNDRGGRGDRDGRGGDRGDRGDGRFSRDGRGDRDGRGRGFDAPRAPRLGDSAFRAQRDAMDHAQNALRKLAAQAHGETLTRLLSAWEGRDAEKLPSAQELGRVQPAVRSTWAQALGSAAKSNVDTNALLRLEIAADVPTPADQLTARRAYQLQLLTRRNDPSPQETWGKDVASVLASACDEATARRLQNALKVLLKK
ncbi:hypothetical protein SDC9_96972 [bioreactor metagenome]|uniref:DUF349 domain-containing protein n=1 Tax=bioreactor metagenome TaxID=1076179 RepID=A0A645ABF6_9ZZZZ